MGTWGPGSFENDGAGDYRDSATYQLMGRLRSVLKVKRGTISMKVVRRN